MTTGSIKIITEPSVYLVGRQAIDDAELARFLSDEGVESWTTDTDIVGQKLVETAGRLCYHSYARPRPGGNAAYIGHILEVGHGSVIEHCVFNLIITGISRSLTHELVRHRVGISPSQLSQRYVDESDVAFVVPPRIEVEVDVASQLISRFGTPNAKARDVLDWGNRHLGVDGIHQLSVEEGAGLRWIMSMEQSQADYIYLSDYLSAPEISRGLDKTDRRKRAREAARSVLPNATETKIFITANARALRHFLELRGSRDAEAEMNRLSLKLLGVLLEEAPAMFSDYRVETLPDGRREIATQHYKI